MEATAQSRCELLGQGKSEQQTNRRVRVAWSSTGQPRVIHCSCAVSLFALFTNLVTLPFDKGYDMTHDRSGKRPPPYNFK